MTKAADRTVYFADVSRGVRINHGKEVCQAWWLGQKAESLDLQIQEEGEGEAGILWQDCTS